MQIDKILLTEKIYIQQINRNQYNTYLKQLETKGQLTKAVAVVICEPPDAPITMATRPLASRKIAGVMEDMGRLPGAMRFSLEGARPPGV